MEIYLPVIQATLAEWLQLTIDHPLYAAALVISVWLLTALLYSIKVAGLNKKNAASERLRASAETNLNSAQLQLQQAQAELAAVTEQQGQAQQLAEAEKQRALASEQQIIQRNQQIAATIQSLASSFDIGERPLPVTGILKADDLWQQHDKVIKQLIDRLHTEQQAKTVYQAEKAKLVETEAKLVSLQANLESQTSLVLALQTQTTTLQQQQNDTQRDLTDTLKKHQADLARLIQLERQAAQFAAVQTHAAPITPPIHHGTVEQIATATEQPVLSPRVELVDKAAEKLQDLSKKPEPPTATSTHKDDLITSLQATAQPIPTDMPSVLINNEQPEAAPVPPVTEPVPVPTVEPVAETLEKPSKGSALKGLYQKFTTKKPEQPEPASEMLIAEPELVPPAPVTKAEPVEEIPEKSRLKGLYQKYTMAKVHEKDLAPESFDDSSGSLEDKADQITEKLEQLKGLYGKFFSKKDK